MVAAATVVVVVLLVMLVVVYAVASCGISFRERTKGSLQKVFFFTGGIPRISQIPMFSRISRKWSDSPLFSTLRWISLISRILIL